MRLALVMTTLSILLMAPYAQAEQHAVNFVAQYKQAMDLRQGADKILYANMERIADALGEFRETEGHFPEPGVEQEKALRFFARTLAKNPYTKTAIAGADEKKPCKITFAYDMQLDLAKAKKAATQPPQNWRAEPGSIFIITNGSGRLIIWGASSDGQPLIDPKNYTYKHVYRDFLVDIAEDGCQTLL